jgi:hypothetical protein
MTNGSTTFCCRAVRFLAPRLSVPTASTKHRPVRACEQARPTPIRQFAIANWRMAYSPPYLCFYWLYLDGPFFALSG